MLEELESLSENAETDKEKINAIKAYFDCVNKLQKIKTSMNLLQKGDKQDVKLEFG